MKFVKKTYIGFLSIIVVYTLIVTAMPYKTTVILNSDDGTEIDKSNWYEGGYSDYLNYMGIYEGKICDTGFRFYLKNLNQGEEIAYARLRFASKGSEITSSLKLSIRGVLQDSPTSFNQTERPSQKTPKTQKKINWEMDDNWGSGTKKVPLYYSSPDIAPILNEILSLPNWGSGPEGKTMILTISNYDSIELFKNNYVKFNDHIYGGDLKSPVILEIYKNVYDTFIGKELLGRPTDKSVTVNLYSLIETDVLIEYGTIPGIYNHRSKIYGKQPAETPIEITLENLKPDTQYYYRLRYREAGTGKFEKGKEHTFHTQRTKESTFNFAIQSDSHIKAAYKLPQNSPDIQLYNTTLQNIADGNPDFLISLGDFVMTESYAVGNTRNIHDSKERFLLQRKHIDGICHSIPFYLVLGNHEGEQGWYYNSDLDDVNNKNSLLFKTLNARKEIMPNPIPDDFYSGNTDLMPDVGLREDYYSWEWGDALFVVLDPYHYTKTKPHKMPPGSTGSMNGWDWTLGEQQYNWLYDTLHNSTAKWKFIFTHHLTSSTKIDPPDPNWIQSYYGKGGIEVAKYAVDGNPSFEWGGEDEDGNNIFDIKRPGWSHGPIHDILVSENVTILFHGHDHFFAKQDLDGIVYQMCPKPEDSEYDLNGGFKKTGKYTYGDFLPNSGHLQVSVNPDFVKVEYVRSYLPGDGLNGDISYSYTIE